MSVTDGQPDARPSPLVSVVMATYNCGRFLAEAVESVLAQTYAPFELHVIDDGSTDDTPAVLARFRDDPRVTLHRQANAGQTKAKNAGIRASRGEFIGFCDADDLWLPHKLAVQMPVLIANPRIGVAYTRYGRIAEDGSPLPLDDEPDYKTGTVTGHLFKTNFVPFGTAVVRRDCLDRMGPFDERHRMGIDWELWLRLSTQYEFALVDSVTYLYRLWGGQMSRNWTGRYEYAFRIMRDFVDAHPGLLPEDVIREAWADSYVQRARMRCADRGQFLPALADLSRAVGHKPAFWPAWKSVGHVVLTATGVRRR